MDTPHFRGPQLPTSHVVPGAPGAPGHPPRFGFVEPPPPFIIPAAFLTEIIMAVRSESAAQNRLLSNHYTNLKQDYNAIKEDFQLCVHQTDRILTEQYTRFELRLEGIQKCVRQSHDSQTAAIADLGTRLDALEGVTKASRDALVSKIATVVETMGHEFETVVATTGATSEQLTQLPTVDNSDVTTAPPPLPPIPEVVPITPSVDHESPQDPPPQDNLFDAPSPLTPISTPSSRDQGEPVVSPEIPEPHPTPADTAPRKRKRASQGRRSAKRTRRGRKQHRAQETQEDVSYEVEQPEEDHTDPSIWPPLIEDGVGDQRYVECDRCKKWFHFGCVGLRADHGDGTPWECPVCVRCPTRDVGNVPHGGGMCSRPGCTGSEMEEYFMDRLLGRCYVADQDTVKYLVAYEGYDLDQCTWETPDSFSHDSSRIEEFLDWWTIENPGIDVESLDPHEAIFLHDVHVLARTGLTWPGA